VDFFSRHHETRHAAVANAARPIGPRFSAPAALAAVVAAALLGGCAAQTLVVGGRLTSDARIAAPAAAQVVVELRGRADTPVLAEQREALAGRALPLRFELRVERDRLPPGAQPVVRAAIIADGWAQWLSAPVEVGATHGRVVIGDLTLAPATRPLAFQTVIDCGGRRFVVGVADDAMQLQDGAPRHELRSAGGERMEAVDDPSTYVIADTTQTRVSVRGQVFEHCSRRNE
jgi:uncharacterized lipoprotein YbaY